MNLESIKKSLAKIPAWVKKNPKQAGVVAVVIVVIAYFAIKRGAQDSGETTAAPGEESLDSLGGGLGASELTSGGGGSSIIPGAETPASTTTTTTTTTESGGGFDGGGFAESDFTSSFANVPSGFVNTTSYAPASAAAVIDRTAPAPSAAAFVPASQMSGFAAVLSNTGLSSRPSTPIVRPAPAPVAPKVNAPIASRSTQVSRPAPVVIPKTDAEKAGLPKYYTGTSGGRRYVAGVYVGTAAPAPVKSGKSVKKV